MTLLDIIISILIYSLGFFSCMYLMCITPIIAKWIVEVIGNVHENKELLNDY